MGWVTLTLRKRVLKQSHAGYQMRDLQISREKRQLARRKQYETASIQNQQNQALAPLKQSYNELIDELESKRKELTNFLKIAKEYATGNSNGDIATSGKAVIIRNENGEYAGSNTPFKLKLNSGETKYIKFSELSASEDGKEVWYERNDTKYFETSSEDLQRFDMYDFTELSAEYNLPDISTLNEDNISALQTQIESEISNIQMEKEDAQLEYTEDVNREKTFYEDELAMLEEDVNDQETMLELEQSDVESQMEAISQEMQAVGEAVSTQIQNSTIRLA